MIARVLFLIFLASPLYVCAQPSSKASRLPRSEPTEDSLAKHLSAAETYQVSNDLSNAAIENNAVAGIALHRLGNVAIEEGRFQDAVKLLSEARSYHDNPQLRVDLAVAYQRLGDSDRAAVEARAAIDLDPKFVRARYILGNILYNNGDYKAALPELEKVILLAPDFDSAYALGLTYLHLRQSDRAKLLFEEIQNAIQKARPDLHILFGQAYEQTDHPLEAEREFRRALALAPRTPRANFYLGYVILQHGGSERLAEAGQAFERELKLVPNDFHANFFAGVVASSENDHSKAIKLLVKAVQIDPFSSEAHLFLGQSQFELQQLTVAEKNLRRAVVLAKNDTNGAQQSRRTHYLLGRLLIRTGRKAEGENELAAAARLQEKLLETTRSEVSQILGQVVADTKGAAIGRQPASATTPLSPERAASLKKLKLYLANVAAQAFHNLGVILVQTSRAPEALGKFETAARWKPDYPGLDRNWGITGFRMHQFDTAVAPLARHLKANPQDGLVREMLATSYYFTKSYKPAVDTLRPVEADLISKPELAFFYGISLIHLQRNREAIPVFARLSEASRTNPEALSYAAQGFMFLGDYERAAKEFQSVASLSSEMPKTHYYLGQSMIRLNRLDEADRAFRRELQINPVDEYAKYHLALSLIERKLKTDEAVALLKEAIALRSDYSEAHYQLGKIFIERGETVKAIEHLEEAVNSDKTKDYIFYQLSIAYRRASRAADSERALKTYQALKAANRKTEIPTQVGNSSNVPR